jgi:hypothetical protein
VSTAKLVSLAGRGLITVLEVVFGKGLSSVNTALTAAKTERVLAMEASNQEKQIAAEVEIAQLEVHRDILIAEQSNRLTRWIRPAFAAPFIIYDFKVVVWDKVLGLGATDDFVPRVLAASDDRLRRVLRPETCRAGLDTLAKEDVDKRCSSETTHPC